MPWMYDQTIPDPRRSRTSQRRGFSQSCKLHFERKPLKLTKGSKQYVYDDSGYQYLDCINNAAHVGHCHPHVVHAGQKQLAQLMHCQGFVNEVQSAYAQRLIDTLPEALNTCFLVNSGSEANDLALRLARAYTRKHDVIVMDNGYHGSTTTTILMSPLKRGRASCCHRCEWVHVVSCPDTFRGVHQDSATAGEKYAEEVKQAIQNMHTTGRQACAFFSEAIMTSAGVVVPPKDYFDHVYRYVKSAGALCIINEVGTGLGRCGEYYWGFQHFNIIPDIVTVGSPLANGQPLAAVITRREIADCFGEYLSKFGGNPLSCSMGLAVLDVMQNEKLLSSCQWVGRQLLQGLRDLQQRHRYVGDVRGMGLCIGIDIVQDKESRKPAKVTAEEIMYSLREEHVLVSVGGVDDNVIILRPPLCFNMENVRDLLAAFETVLSNIEAGTGTHESSAVPFPYANDSAPGPSSSEGGRAADNSISCDRLKRALELVPSSSVMSTHVGDGSCFTGVCSKKRKFEDMD